MTSRVSVQKQGVKRLRAKILDGQVERRIVNRKDVGQGDDSLAERSKEFSTRL